MRGRCHVDLARAVPGAAAAACAAKNGGSATCYRTGWPISQEPKPLDPKTAAPRRRRRATSTTVATSISRERAPATLPPPVPPRTKGPRHGDGPAGPRRSSGSRFFPDNGGAVMAPARDLGDGVPPFAMETAPTTLPPPAAPRIGLVDGAAVADGTISRDGGPSGRTPTAADHGNGQCHRRRWLSEAGGLVQATYGETYVDSTREQRKILR